MPSDKSSVDTNYFITFLFIFGWFDGFCFFNLDLINLLARFFYILLPFSFYRFHIYFQFFMFGSGLAIYLWSTGRLATHLLKIILI